MVNSCSLLLIQNSLDIGSTICTFNIPKSAIDMSWLRASSRENRIRPNVHIRKTSINNNMKTRISVGVALALATQLLVESFIIISNATPTLPTYPSLQRKGLPAQPAEDDSPESSLSTSSSSDDPSPTKQQEMLMEELSRIGAKKIAKLDVSERAKRAMLAEAIEDRIFETTTKIEDLLDDQGRLAEQDRDQALQLATQTKLLQMQYNELVSGNPSSVLQSLEALGQ